MNHFPKLLSSQIGFDVARTMPEGFDRHYRIFRDAAIHAKTLFERADWHGLQKLARERITSYDERVDECVVLLEDEYDGDNLVIRHLYIERRMVPLNLYLQKGTDADVDHGIREYGNAIKELMQANIFQGDMLYKNFGVTRHGRVVFYGYDEIEYLTDCNVRAVPAPRNEEDEMSGESWYSVGQHDIFPETYGTFLLGDPRVRRSFLQHHADFFDPALWQRHKNHLLKGELPDFYPYDDSARFSVRYPERFAEADSADAANPGERAARAA